MAGRDRYDPYGTPNGKGKKSKDKSDKGKGKGNKGEDTEDKGKGKGEGKLPPGKRRPNDKGAGKGGSKGKQDQDDMVTFTDHDDSPDGLVIETWWYPIPSLIPQTPHPQPYSSPLGPLGSLGLMIPQTPPL